MAGMKGLKKTRRIQIILLTIVALIGSVALMGYAMKDGINFFRSPTQVTTQPPGPNEVFRLGGLVEVGSLIRDQGDTMTFTVTDSNKTVKVAFKGVLPDLFAEGAGVVATGAMQGDTFVASEILAKHDEKYMPKEVIDSLKAQGVYQAPSQ